MERTYKFTAFGKARARSGVTVFFNRRGEVDAMSPDAAIHQITEIIEDTLRQQGLTLADKPVIRLALGGAFPFAAAA